MVEQMGTLRKSHLNRNEEVDRDEKVSCALLALTMVFCLAACGSTDSTPTDAPDDGGAATDAPDDGGSTTVAQQG